MKKLIKNGTLVTSSAVFRADLLIEGEKIKCIGTGLVDDEAELIDASGKYVFPGAVDVHTHMDLDAGIARAVDDFYTGTVAAACGGTTSIVDHMAFAPEGSPLHYDVDLYHKLADGKAVIDYGFHGTVQHVNQEILDELPEMIRDGIPSVKVYTTYAYHLNDIAVLQVLNRMKQLHGVTAFHCENHEIVEFLKQKYRKENPADPMSHAKSRPNLAEAEAVANILKMARLIGDAPVYIVHLSTKEGLEEVRRARRDGQKNIYAETCIQYLLLTEEKYREPDALKYIMSPPLRTKEDCDALWEGLADGSIQVVATDHCPFNYAIEKQMGKEDFTACPNGAPGVEERLMLLYSEGVAKGRISLSRLAEVACTNPCDIYGLAPEKGRLLPGSDADLVILDPNGSFTITHSRMHSAVDYTSYEGMKLAGNIDLVMQRGNVIARDHVFLGHKGDGRFLKRKIRNV